MIYYKFTVSPLRSARDPHDKNLIHLLFCSRTCGSYFRTGILEGSPELANKRYRGRELTATSYLDRKKHLPTTWLC